MPVVMLDAEFNDAIALAQLLTAQLHGQLPPDDVPAHRILAELVRAGAPEWAHSGIPPELHD